MKYPYIDYRCVNKAIQYYKSLGYQYIEVPWVVEQSSVEITCPSSLESIERTMVASGEQGFLQLIIDGIRIKGKYVCATPCYRPLDYGRSANHYSQFFKVEVGVFDKKYPRDNQYTDVVCDVFEFMSRYHPGCYCEETVDEARLNCRTIISHDIMSHNGLEIGSCGIRHSNSIGYWIYATGAALPRLYNEEV